MPDSYSSPPIISQLTRIGAHHLNHCEDYTVVESLGGTRLLAAVLDGCTMGTDSYFAATLVGKLLRRIAVELSYEAFYQRQAAPELADTLREVMRRLMPELRALKSQLQLRDDELLTTLLLAVVNTATGAVETLALGDGLICLDGQLTEYEQQNTPDYLGYHLAEDFELWYAAQAQRLSALGVRELSLSTDGIFTFVQPAAPAAPLPLNPVTYLLGDTTAPASPHMLRRKLLALEQRGLVATDDLGIVQLRWA
ncbi:protein phosphatase 2C domain-containing protein [Hymenobacter sp. CRA2]|uniref:protein phosphatase 2C domain-containing protein n=1 Tax=Hymenobacter sp. CRA2 TaxID=1955620 RepID=UPI00098F5A52|nr:protein phosphatase 2C domain-containing protein [Hymenobacter sp. CRA2]OON68296.1 hypothetical protein B0919_14180 [Hymenobacter sp. CRA2]